MRVIGFLTGLVLLFQANAALAVYADRLIAYGGAGQGKVVFDGKTHASRGLLCGECHPALFATRKQALITLDDHKSNRACFACHDGKRAGAECGSCHRK